LAGGLCALLGVYIVLRGMSYIGHGLSHAIFGGAVVSYVMEINFYIGAGLWGFVSGLLIHAVTKKRQIGADAAIGIVTTASFAIGVAVISRVRLLVLAAVAGATALLVFFLYKQLLFVTFDPEVASTYGVRAGLVDVLFTLILTASVIASMQVLGVTMIAAAIVIPAVTARLLSNRFATLLWLSTAIGAGCGLVGMYASYYLDISSGATIVLVATGAFLLALAFTQIAALVQHRPRPVPAANVGVLFD
jgi:ABC-type Mn2+/Zn2+ transport system permease subunit